jgi:hypothetical protein
VAAGGDRLGEPPRREGNGIRPGEADGIEALGRRLLGDGGAQRGRIAQKSRSA